MQSLGMNVSGETVTLCWCDALSASKLKKMIARVANNPELHPHVFVGTQCVGDAEEVEGANTNNVMLFSPQMVAARSCRVSLNKEVADSKANQGVISFVSNDTNNSFQGWSRDAGAGARSADNNRFPWFAISQNTIRE